MKYDLQILIGKKIKKQLGLDECRFMFSQQQPMQRETQMYFQSIGIDVCDMYGMSETTGTQIINSPLCRKIGTIGWAAAWGQ